MAVSSILGIFMPMSIAVDPKCDYYQDVDVGQQYYIYNQQYPNRYPSGISCRWVAQSEPNTRMILTCEDIDIPKSSNCVGDRLSISPSGDTNFDDTRNYCGKGRISLVSDSNVLVVGLFATWYSSGGRFLCTLTSLPTDQPTTTTTPKPPTCDCGWKQQRRIVGGVETGVNEFPAMAGLVDAQIKQVYCGASVISDRYALTAAHCLFKRVEIIGLLVGDHDLTTGTDTNATALYRITSMTLHPDFNNVSLENDVAVVKTETTVVFSAYVGPVCLPFRYATKDFTGDSATALGWGTTEFTGPRSDVLQAVNLTVIPTSRCIEELLPDNVVNMNQICTYTPEKDTCQFDSGGPLYYFDSRIRRLVQVGIISYGIACATDNPAVNTRVTSYLLWIVSVTEDTNYCIK